MIIVKDSEITSLNEELNALQDFRTTMALNHGKKTEQALKMIEENKGIIKRQNKLITDLNQKNEVLMVAVS